MKYQQPNERVRESLSDTFAKLETWFDLDDEIRSYQPQCGRWTIDQVLEHVAITNHFLMLTLEKNVIKAEKRALNDAPADGESDLEILNIIGQRGSFDWERPDHMEPNGESTPDQVRATLSNQLADCLAFLDRIGDGIGSLVLTTMSANDLGKIDCYQWIYFIAQHANRHLQQMDEIRTEQANQ